MDIELTEEEIKTLLKIREERARVEAETAENKKMIEVLRQKIEAIGLFGHLRFRFEIMESGRPSATARTNSESILGGRDIKINETSTGTLNIQIGALGWSNGIRTSLEEFLNIYSNLKKACDLKVGDYYVVGENLRRLERPFSFIKVGTKNCLSDEFHFKYYIETTYYGRIETDEEFNCDDRCYTEFDADGCYTTFSFGGEARKEIDKMIGRV